MVQPSIGQSTNTESVRNCRFHLYQGGRSQRHKLALLAPQPDGLLELAQGRTKNRIKFVIFLTVYLPIDSTSLFSFNMNFRLFSILTF